jgi:hypothetical protein
VQGASGIVWTQGYHDRFIRDGTYFENALAYTRNIPV